MGSILEVVSLANYTMYLSSMYMGLAEVTISQLGGLRIFSYIVPHGAFV